jgi:hypothetical protein
VSAWPTERPGGSVVVLWYAGEGGLWSEMRWSVYGSEFWLIRLWKVLTYFAAWGNIISCLLTYLLHGSETFLRS